MKVEGISRATNAQGKVTTTLHLTAITAIQKRAEVARAKKWKQSTQALSIVLRLKLAWRSRLYMTKL